MDKFLNRIKPINIEDEIRSSYLDYSMSVIVGRALPDVRDGLKPVHRRVLFAMSELGNEWNRAHKKSARVVGDVIGKYHPHGDSAIYDALVRMAQPWSLRYPLADGQGNFGSIDGDPPAAMRYTEVRMARMASEMLSDIEKDTVDWQANYDESTVEPKVLPARIPNLLVNGSSGIAVGMSTNIPPHNMREVIDATVALIDQPKLTSLDLMQFIPGPDFPTSGLIAADDNLRKAYTTGRGIILVRGKAHREEANARNGRSSIVITEIPYQLNKTRLIENIAELVRSKRVEGISDIRDESSRKGMRIVLDLKREANADIILRHLYKHTPLQSSFGIILLAIVNGRPEVLSLKSLLKHFISHRKEVVTRRTRYELRKAEERAHILEGFKIALDHLDEVIQTIRSSQSPVIARERLIERFGFSERQAQAVLDLRLQRLTAMERDKIIEEYQQILALIEELRALLADEALLYGVIKDELQAVREQFGDERRTEILHIDTTVTDEDLIPVEDMVVTISHSGYIKRDLLSEYRSQRRGGRGKKGMSTKDEDFVRDLFVASTHSYLMIFTSFGRAYWVKVYNLPQVSRTAKGKPIVNIVDLQPGDSVAAILAVDDFTAERTLVVATRQGIVKRMNLTDFSRPRSTGVIAATVDEGDEIIAVRQAEEDQQVLISTAKGMAIRFPVSDVRVMGRGARGVRGIRLADGDRAIGMETVSNEDIILTVTARGNGKRTPVEDYRLQSRAGQGVIDIKTGERNGEVVGMTRVAEQDHVLLITDLGKIIRTPAGDIRQIGRNTWGVTIIRLDDDVERVTGLALVQEGEDDESDEDSEDDSYEGETLEGEGGEGDAETPETAQDSIDSD